MFVPRHLSTYLSTDASMSTCGRTVYIRDGIDAFACGADDAPRARDPGARRETTPWLARGGDGDD